MSDPPFVSKPEGEIRERVKMKKDIDDRCSAIMSHAISAIAIEQANLKKDEHIELQLNIDSVGFTIDCRRVRDD